MKKYKSIISLGHFCSVALEIERMGFRSNSMPFDWLICDMKGVVKAISTGFDKWLQYDNLYQSKRDRRHYYDQEYGIWFYHDFNPYKSLESQMAVIQQKYNRRIVRFYSTIIDPTLFIYYIHGESDSSDLRYIEDHYQEIVALLRGFNPNNDIIFIGNNDTASEKITIFHVDKDDGDVVAREGWGENMLLEAFERIDFPESVRRKNLEEHAKKEKERKSHKLMKRVKSKMMCIFEYSHSRCVP